MRRKLFTMLLVAMLAVILVIPCSAIGEQESDMRPYYNSITPDLSFQGNTAYCEVRITSVGDTINARLELWQGNICLVSWSDSAVSRLAISEEYPAVSKRTYTLKVVGTIGGETISCSPVSRTCP